MAAEVNITPLMESDFAAYRRLRIEMVSHHPTAYNIDPNSISRRIEGEWQRDATEFFNDPNRERFIARTGGGYPVGIVGCLERAGLLEIGGLYVQEPARGNGIGRLLLSRSIDFGEENGYTKAALWVSSDNPMSRAWYECLGFEPHDPPKTNDWWDGSAITEEYLVQDLQVIGDRLK